MSAPFVLTGLDDSFEVFTGDLVEGISQTTHARVRLVSGDVLDLEALLGKSVTLSLTFGEFTRNFHLVVRDVVELGVASGGLFVYELMLVDPLDLLSLRTNIRHFQEKTTREIVDAVLADAGIDSSLGSWQLLRALPKREYCVQHRESDFAFVDRLLAHEGICRIPAADDDQGRFIFSDDAESFLAIDGEPVLTLHDQATAEEDAVRSFEVEYSAVSDEIVLRDWNYQTPQTDLTSTARVADEPQSSLFEFPGGFTTPAEGKALAKIRAEELASRKAIARASAFSPRLRPGRWFELAGVTRAELAVKWLVREVHHQFSLGGDAAGRLVYQCDIVTSPLAQPYRPPRTTPRPTIAGSHSVKVMGPASEEIHTDALGRMKGKFYWDRSSKDDDQASGWMRVLQLPIGGSQALARVGWEMIVRYADGDPDRPIAVARADNATHVAPYAYPKAGSSMAFKTLSSPGGAKHNELALEDGGGGMKFGVTASKDWNEQVNHDKTEKIGVDEELEVGTDLATTIGASQTIDVGGSRSLSVAADAGTKVGKNRTKTVGAAENVSVTGNTTEKILGNDTEFIGASGMESATMGVTKSCQGSHVWTVGGTMLTGAVSKCSVMVGGAKSEVVGAAKLVVSAGAVSESIIGAAAVMVGGVCVHGAGGNRTATTKGTSDLVVGGLAMLNAGEKINLKAKSITISVLGTANLLGGGGVVNLTPASGAFVGMVVVKGGGAVKVSGNPNMVG